MENSSYKVLYSFSFISHYICMQDGRKHSTSLSGKITSNVILVVVMSCWHAFFFFFKSCIIFWVRSSYMLEIFTRIFDLAVKMQACVINLNSRVAWLEWQWGNEGSVLLNVFWDVPWALDVGPGHSLLWSSPAFSSSHAPSQAAFIRHAFLLSHFFLGATWWPLDWDFWNCEPS